MSIQSEITRISGNVSDALTAIGNKGVTVPTGSNSDDLADLIGAIQTGGALHPQLSTLSCLSLRTKRQRQSRHTMTVHSSQML